MAVGITSISGLVMTPGDFAAGSKQVCSAIEVMIAGMQKLLAMCKQTDQALAKTAKVRVQSDEEMKVVAQQWCDHMDLPEPDVTIEHGLRNISQ